MHCSNKKLALQRLRDGGFSRSGKAGQPDDSATMSVLGGARLCVDLPFAPENVLALHRSAIGVNAAVNNSAAANHAIINQNKTTQWRNAIVVIQNDWRARLNGHAPDLVSLQLLRLGRAPLERGRIHHLIERYDLTLYFLSRQARSVEMRQTCGLPCDPEKIRMDCRMVSARRTDSAIGPRAASPLLIPKSTRSTLQ